MSREGISSDSTGATTTGATTTGTTTGTGRRRLARACGLLLAVLVGGCAGTGGDLQRAGPWSREACTTSPDRCAYDVSHASHLFATAYQGVSDFYVEDVAAADLARAGFGGLVALDPRLAVRVGDAVVTLTRDGKPAGRFPVPAADEARNWGELTAMLAATARTVSPRLAAQDAERLYEAVFDAMLARLDPVSHYAGRSEARRLRAGRGDIVDIGAHVQAIDAGIKILAVLDNTPAERAGLRADDLITEIDGSSAVGLSRREGLRRLRGPARTEVELRILRGGGAQSLPITVTRSPPAAPRVAYRADGPIGYLRLPGFGRGTARSVHYKVVHARRTLGAGLAGFILDLRGNPGGRLDQAAQVADLFLDHGPIVSTRGRHPHSDQEFRARPEDLAEGLPIVVLVDGRSASAAEILAAALQDAGRAVVVGANSFGKGTVQTVVPLPNEGELTLTWAKLYAPSGYGLHGRGILPNICTSGGEASAARVLDRLRRGAFIFYGSGNLAEGDDPARLAAWRARCPRDQENPEVTLDVARALLVDSLFYARALARPSVMASAAGR